jgi:hypothetical protein
MFQLREHPCIRESLPRHPILNWSLYNAGVLQCRILVLGSQVYLSPDPSDYGAGRGHAGTTTCSVVSCQLCAAEVSLDEGNRLLWC